MSVTSYYKLASTPPTQWFLTIVKCSSNSYLYSCYNSLQILKSFLFIVYTCCGCHLLFPQASRWCQNTMALLDKKYQQCADIP